MAAVDKSIARYLCELDRADRKSCLSKRPCALAFEVSGDWQLPRVYGACRGALPFRNHGKVGRTGMRDFRFQGEVNRTCPQLEIPYPTALEYGYSFNSIAHKLDAG